jgi:hypothetical protein
LVEAFEALGFGGESVKFCDDRLLFFGRSRIGDNKLSEFRRIESALRASGDTRFDAIPIAFGLEKQIQERRTLLRGRS